MEKWLTPLDKQQQNKQCLSNGESEKALDETDVSVKYLVFSYLNVFIFSKVHGLNRGSRPSQEYYKNFQIWKNGKDCLPGVG